MQEFSGLQYLKIDIANNMGLDKKDWDERISWFQENEHKLMDLVQEAETPALFYAGVKAYYDAKRGVPSGYPISLDGTSSGFQILAVLTGDRQAAELCNVVPTGHREDAYTLVYEAMLYQLGESKGRINRVDTKKAVMTSLYSSKAEPKRVFGEGELLRLFYSTMKTLAPAAWELNESFIDMWDSTTDKHSWVLPDNFHVHVKVMDQVAETIHFKNEPFEVFKRVNQPTPTGRSLGANTTHSIDGLIVREISRRCNYNPEQVAEVRRVLTFTPVDYEYELDENCHMTEILWNHYKNSGYLSARILDYITADSVHIVDRKVVLELIESMPKKPFQVLSIHDCFRVLPNYANDLRKQYNLQLYLLAKSEMLSFIISQILGQEIQIGKLDPTLAEDILYTDYALS